MYISERAVVENSRECRSRISLEKRSDSFRGWTLFVVLKRGARKKIPRVFRFRFFAESSTIKRFSLVESYRCYGQNPVSATF